MHAQLCVHVAQMELDLSIGYPQFQGYLCVAVTLQEKPDRIFFTFAESKARLFRLRKSCLPMVACRYDGICLVPVNDFDAIAIRVGDEETVGSGD